MSSTIQLPKSIYEIVIEQAKVRQQSPDHYVAELLAGQLLPPHPYVEIVHSRSGPRAVVRGTRIGIDVIAGYNQAGYPPREIAEDILPQLTLAEVYDSLSYYEDHRALVEAESEANTPEIWKARLREQMGETAVAELLG